MPHNLKKQFSFVYLIGYKDGVVSIFLLQLIVFIVLKALGKI